MSISDELERLAALHRDGVIDADEFTAAKRQLLDPPAYQTPPATQPPAPPVMPDPAAALPPSPSTAPAGPSPHPPATRGLQQLGAVVTVVLYLFAAGSTLLLIFAIDTAARADAFDRLRTGAAAAEMLDANDRAFTVLDVLSTATLFTAVLFIVWLWQLHRHVATLPGPPLRMSRGWTIGAWFIPIAFLWLPYQVVDELHGRLARPTAPVRTWWWSLILTALGLQALAPAAEADGLDLLYSVLVLTAVAMGTAAVAGARTVTALTDTAVDAVERPGVFAAEAVFVDAAHAALPTTQATDRATLVGLGYELLAARIDDRLDDLLVTLAGSDATHREELVALAALAQQHLAVPPLPDGPA